MAMHDFADFVERIDGAGRCVVLDEADDLDVGAGLESCIDLELH